MKKAFILAFIFLVAFASQSISQDTTLCRNNEEVILAFKIMKGKKLVSLCKDRAGNYLVYRFGVPGKIELEFPKLLDSTSWQKFSFNGAKRFGGIANAGFSDYRISFTNNNVTYELFDSWSDEYNSKEIGVIVTGKMNKTVLRGNYSSKKGTLLRLDDEQERIRNLTDDE